ncbi:MAG: ABC transporter ATP-binding protein [Candidatus Saccharimonadales bacterium]
MAGEIAIKVEGVSKSFKLPHEKQSSLKSTLINFHRRGYEKQRVLKDISFEINKGEFFGIVGRNGSGKSTLLKLLSGIYTPDKGSITVNGKLTPFIELGVGFNPELSGRENVFLNGALLGFNRKEMNMMYDEIVKFAELERFMDQKLKNYSSGMQVRLAFSIAIRANTDILVLDEVLAVGDEAFQRKCEEYFMAVKKKKKTIILVTHSMDSVRRYCNRAMLIVDGRVKKIGSPDKVAGEYSDIFIQEHISEVDAKATNDKKTKSIKQLSDVVTDQLNVVQKGKIVRAVEFMEDFSLRLEISAQKNHEDLTMGIHIFDQLGRDMMAISTKTFGKFDLIRGKNIVSFNIQNIFTDGDYYVNMAIEENDTKKLLLQAREVIQFTITGINATKHSKYGLTHPKVEMNYESPK